MEPFLIEGDTLGEKHRNYNKLVNETIKNNPKKQVTAIDYEDPDLDNLYKIDIACSSRNVEYILEVLKCEDMLYFSRVINQSTWLIRDQQYSSIINPEYLYNSLSPQMTSKAFNKLILHIRLNLKDENRVEGFFNHFKEKDLQKALKWLPGCSIPFIETIIQKYSEDIPEKILKLLYEKSITFLKIVLRNCKSHFRRRDLILPALFLIKRNVGTFLDIIEATDMNDVPGIGPKNTKKVMENYPERIMKNLDNYIYIVDVPIFAKYIRKEDAKDFILTHMKDKNMRSWFVNNNIKHFVNRIPSEERFDFIKKYFIEKSYCTDEKLDGETWSDVVEHCCPPPRGNVSSSKNIYSWYVYAPFDRAFGDLKQLIRNESNPAERIAIFNVMLTCAGSNKQNILMLLKYYREHHINEPFKFKIQFVNQLLTKTYTHKYDKTAWGYLNDLFNSMEVYSKSDNNVQSCVRSIILHGIINGEIIPEIIINKFEFENLDSKIKFTSEEREKIFNFLFKFLLSKIKNDFIIEKEFNETVDYLIKVLNLLKDWNKELKDYPCILQKIKDLILVKQEHSWNRDLSGIYNVKKSWRKLLLAESILLNPTEDSCINALKYGPQVLEVYRQEINKLCIRKNMHFAKFLKTIRIYYYQSLRESFKKTFLENLDQKSSHDILIKRICTLLARIEISDFIKKYVPTESNIDWRHPDELELSLRKYIAKDMHLARPHPPLTVALLYAKGDYLQYVLPSLNAILYNISATNIAENLPKLLNTPVSLQQHGIRAAFSKLKHDKLKDTFSHIWQSSKNSTIRTVIFCETYNMLCKESDESIIFEIWDLLSMFIENLTLNENKKIYFTLSKVNKVPLTVRAEFWMKSYDFLKRLPATANCACLIDDLHSEMKDIMETLDVDFMAKICLEIFDFKFTTQLFDFTHQVSLYLLSTKTETAQIERYQKILLPILEKSTADTAWNKELDNTYYARNNLSDIFANMSREFENVVLHGKMLFPIAMYTAALNKLKSSLPIIENYMLLTDLKLSLGYMQILQDQKQKTDCEKNFDDNQEDEWKDSHAIAAPIFGRLCLEYLKEDVANFFPSIYIIFAEALEYIFGRYNIRTYDQMVFLKPFLDSKDFIQAYLLVMNLIPRYVYEDNEKAMRNELRNVISCHPSEEVVMHYWLMRLND